ncbi:hypothetical protein B0H11DRAFT_2007797 [Mycena galericulata]|nr:hypothetical protein B0H11DRAFT_2007797 [Mycena galericulata]
MTNLTSSFSRSLLLPEASAIARVRETHRSYAQPPDHLASTMSALYEELTRHDTEISRLRAQLSGIESDRAALQNYYDNCRALLSPIRRLPSEILAEIFAWCVSSFTPAFADITPKSSVCGTEMARLAKAPLLVVSQVCARWHSVAMGTPTLWNTIELDGVLWRTPADAKRMMGLLKSALDRGGKSLLNIEVTIDNTAPHIPALELMAAHSERWQIASFICAVSDLQPLSAAKGRLPCLESLQLWGTPSPLEIFEDAPRLTEVEFGGTPESLAGLAKLPLQQLQVFRCGEFVGLGEFMGLGVSPAMNLMPHLSNTAHFFFQLRLLDFSAGFNESTSVPSVISPISSLSLNVVDGFSRVNIGPTMARIIEGLTLPSLENLEIDSEEYPDLPLPWPHAQFLGLSTRSSFDTHLRCLKLYHSVITETELLECLETLPVLERLSVSDHQVVQDQPGGGTDQLLITDTLLAALTRTQHSPTLVPHLRSFACQSLMKFDDNVYVDFVASRYQGGDGQPFKGEIWWLPGHSRNLGEAAVVRLDEMCRQKQFTFSFGPAEPDSEL